MAESKLTDVIGTSLEKIKELADGETVIGDPIVTAGGTTVIPVSKVSVGLASGGLDYAGKKDSANQNFGGGGGTGITVTPIAFLIIAADGGIQLLPITTPAQVGTVDKVTSHIEKSPEILSQLKNVFKKDKKEEKDKAEPETEKDETPAEDAKA